MKRTVEEIFNVVRKADYFKINFKKYYVTSYTNDNIYCTDEHDNEYEFTYEELANRNEVDFFEEKMIVDSKIVRVIVEDGEITRDYEITNCNNTNVTYEVIEEKINEILSIDYKDPFIVFEETMEKYGFSVRNIETDYCMVI